VAIIPALQCTSLNGWYPIEIPSESDPDHNYVVHVNPWANRSEQHVCECKAYQFRGRCKHQGMAHRKHCGWNQMEEPDLLTDMHIEHKLCPKCGEPTSWGMWEENNE
jgi:hypothetical protein